MLRSGIIKKTINMSPYSISRNAKLTKKLEEHFPDLDILKLRKDERKHLANEVNNKNKLEKKQRQKQYLAF